MAVITLEVGTTPKRLLSANPGRVVYTLINEGSYNAYVGFDKNVSTTGKTKGIKLAPNGGGMEDEFYKGEVWAIAEGNTEITVVEVSEEEQPKF